MTSVATEPLVAPPATEPAGREWAVVRSLGRIEGRRLLLSPLVLVAAGLMVMAFGRPQLWLSGIREVAANSGFGTLLIAAMTLVASNLATQRSRRNDAEELFSSTPASARARTGAHLVAVLWPAAAAALIPVLVVVAERPYGSAGLTELADLAVGPLLVAGAGALGVLLAVWAPTPVAGPLACVAIAALELFLTSPAVITRGWRWMAFWVDAGDIDLLPPRPALWHLLYLVALVAMAVVGALVRHGLRPRLVLAGVVAIAVMAASAGAQSRSLTSAAWARADALLSQPQAHQVCEVRGDVRYCAFPEYRPLIDRWEPVVEGVRQRVPASDWPKPLEVGQRLTAADLQYAPSDELHTRLSHLADPGTPLPDDGALHPGRGWTRDGVAELGLAAGAASRVVGLPLAPQAPGTLCDTAGQARAVVALWLAAQATPAAGKALRRLLRTHAVQLSRADGSQPSTTHLVLTEDGVQRAAAWGMVEVRHALALQRRPAQEVEARLGAGWDRFTAPATTTAELAAALGLEPVSSTDLGPAADPDVDPHAGPGPGLRLGAPCGS